MAKKKNYTGWILAGAAAVGLWLLSRKQAAAATPAPMLPAPIPQSPALPTTLAPTAPVSLPISAAVQPAPIPSPPATAVTVQPVVSPVSANPQMVTAPGPIGPGEVTDAGVPYDPRMATLQSWAVSALNPCDLSRWNEDQTNFTAAEWNGLYDIYFNDWIGGQGNTAARKAFWDTWRTKYSILTNTPC